MHLRISYFLTIILLGFYCTLNAAEIFVESGGDLRGAVESATFGDIIILEDGGVYNVETDPDPLNAGISISSMQLTIKAEDNAAVKPVVNFSGFNIDGVGNAIEIRGIRFVSTSYDGIRTSYFINFTEAFGGAAFLKVYDCEADGYRRCAIRGNRVEAKCDTIIFDNCILTNLDESYRLFHFGDVLSYDLFQLTNSTVANFTESIVWSYSYSLKKIIIDNCTFNGLTAVSPNIFYLDGDPGSVFKLTDCLITNFTSGGVFRIEGFIADTVRHCRFYSIGDTSNEWDYMEDFVAEDPMYADAENFDFTLPENSPLQTAGTDGGPIGDPRWSKMATAIESNPVPGPASYKLEQNYPNPFNPLTTISYQLQRATIVELRIYNVLGQTVATLVSGHQEAGYHQVQWNPGNFPSGIYYYQLSTDEFNDVKKMVVIR